VEPDAESGVTPPGVPKYWATTFLGATTQVLNNSVVYSNDGMFVTGSFNAGPISLTDVGLSVPKITLQSPQNGNIMTFIAKYLASGELQWATVIDGLGNKDGYSVTSDGSNVYVIGQYTTLGSSISIYNATTTSSPYPTLATPVAITLPGGQLGIAVTFILKINSAGVVQWATIMGGNGTNVRGYGISINGTDVYVSGYFDSGLTGMLIYQNAINTKSNFG
jgi:hypothetical protein